jgi:hypothetical protein
MLNLISWFSFSPSYNFAKNFRQIVSKSETRIRSIITSRGNTYAQNLFKYSTSGSYSKSKEYSKANSNNGGRYQW